MKVCLISGEYPPMQGGVGDYTHELGKALAELGHEVHVLTSAAPTMQYPIPDTQCPIPNTPTTYRSIRRWDWGCWRDIIGLLDQIRPDIVNIQYQTAAYGMHPAINFLPLRLHLSRMRRHLSRSRPSQPTGTSAYPFIRSAEGHPLTVTTFHDLKVPYLFPKAGPVRWWVNLALARWSEAVIVTNVEDLKKLSVYPFIRSLSVVPIGSNIAPRPPADYDRDRWRARWGVGPRDLLLSYFGFLNESKGAETLVRALDRLVRRGYNARLLMVGGKVGSSDPTNVAYLRKVEGLIEELGLADRVLWTGFTPPEEVSANRLASDVCVLPYRDGASFRRGSFMAALAHGLPIVSTRPRVDTPELRHGQNILFVPPDSPTALAGAIARLAEDPALRRRLGEGAAKLARNFAWEEIARKTRAVYEEILAA